MVYNKKTLVFTVTNDLNYDQRMMRICTSLQMNGYQVLLLGRKLKNSLPVSEQTFSQKRIFCFFESGKLFYLEYNVRLFFFLLFTQMDLICAIDLDTIVPCFIISVLRGKKRVYDAHELFCEMKEVVTRPFIHWIWSRLESLMVPRYKNGYTVNKPIQQIFSKKYQVDYEVIMNCPKLHTDDAATHKQPFIIYQGAVNEGRCFETLIPAFQWIDYPFWIYGDGNYFKKAKSLAKQYKVEDKVIFKGRMLPKDLRRITPSATFGITIFENKGLSNYFSLANRFFDYMHAGIPQICVDYPVYKEINSQVEVALLVSDLSSEAIAEKINLLLNDPTLLKTLTDNCAKGRQLFNWQNEEIKLKTFYDSILPNE